MTNQDDAASAKPIVIATTGFSFRASAVAATVMRMIVHASTVSMISKRSKWRTSRT